jgi:hypothetical protein
MINHDVMRLNVAMHDTVGMTIVESFEKLKDVIANIVIGESRIEHLEICIIDVFKDERGSLGLRIADDIKELNNVGSATHVLKNLDFAFDFLLLDRLKNLNDALCIVCHIDAFKDLFDGGRKSCEERTEGIVIRELHEKEDEEPATCLSRRKPTSIASCHAMIH